MGLIHFDLFATLDLVAQAPGGPEEDTEGGFKFGGWRAPFPDEVVGQQVAAAIARMDALLRGRKTYEIFAGYWPHQEDGVDSEIARKFNRISEIRRFTQQTEFRVGRLVAARIRCCDIDTRNRDRHENVHVIGSINFVQTLLSERLFDRLNLFLYPIVLGSGKKVFGSGTVPSNLRLAEPALTSPTGAVLLHYELASGNPRTGDMTREMTRT